MSVFRRKPAPVAREYESWEPAAAPVLDGDAPATSSSNDRLLRSAVDALAAAKQPGTSAG